MMNVLMIVQQNSEFIVTQYTLLEPAALPSWAHFLFIIARIHIYKCLVLNFPPTWLQS